MAGMTIPAGRPVNVRLLGGSAAADPPASTPNDALPVVVGDVRHTFGGFVRVEVVAGGWRFELEVEPAARAALRERATRAATHATRGDAVEVRAMIPGRVVAVAVAVGDAVVMGAPLLVVEAMKMQNEVPSPADAVVAGVRVSPGDTVELGDLLVVLGAPDEAPAST
jgi:biotin carboxyl carrier protein